MIQTKRVEVTEKWQSIAGRCAGFRLRRDFRAEAVSVAPGVNNGLYEYGVFPVEVRPVNAFGQPTEVIKVTAPEWVPLPEGTMALYARHLYAEGPFRDVIGAYRMPFLLDTDAKPGTLLDQPQPTENMTRVLTGQKISLGATDVSYRLPTYGLPFVLFELRTNVALEVRLKMVSALLDTATTDYAFPSDAVALAVAPGRQLIVMGRGAAAPPVAAGEPAPYVVPVPLAAETLLEVHMTGAGEVDVSAMVTLG